VVAGTHKSFNEPLRIQCWRHSWGTTMNDESRSKSGIPGLDEVLFGGLIAQQVYSAHELRNPLAPIRTAAHVLASRRFRLKRFSGRKASFNTRWVIWRCCSMICRLDIARITRGKLELKKKPRHIDRSGRCRGRGGTPADRSQKSPSQRRASCRETRAQRGSLALLTDSFQSAHQCRQVHRPSGPYRRLPALTCG